MAFSEEIRAAVIAACARGEKRGDIARRHGLSKNQVLGIYHRRDCPEPSPLPPSVAPREPVGAAVFTGAAREVDRLKRNCCRWPIGDVGEEDFRFCAAVVERPVVVGHTGVEVPNSYCEIHREQAKGRRQPAPPALGQRSAQGFGVGQPTGRLRGRAA
ncbi:hypothetical protein [Lichenibacterium dinghuense]|uniref:hypothetical protein n=1 Tax=Lichenibacterium dinghuense TaxID=2895977 RepID=UPI001F1A42C0|nr:hypothetical protein [Lichenibacterium sp. 6Y81]